MTTEIYLQSSPLAAPGDTSPEAEILREECERASQLAERAGLSALAKVRMNPLREHCVASAGLQPLTKDEYAVWHEWLPTSYQTGDSHRELGRSRRWAEYVFDTIPISVLEVIADLKEKNTFGMLEVRTPERALTDPVLFGWIGRKVYLLARWGESDERLHSFEEIRAGVKARTRWQELRWKQPGTDTFFCSFTALLVGGAIGAGIAEIIGHQGSTVAAPLTITASAMAAFLPTAWLSIKRWRRIRLTIQHLRQQFTYAIER